ncbi:MAG: hypothetical protein O9301_13255 [Leptospira sp.]|nr:hypothetical protein [Leptospira sp.]
MTDFVALFIFSSLNLIVVLFQMGLAIGMPWGALSMGGKFPGRQPLSMRIVAIVNILLLCFLNLIVGVHSGEIYPEFQGFASKAIWFVVVFFILGTILNTITPSKKERIWAPVCAVQLASSLYLAL